MSKQKINLNIDILRQFIGELWDDAIYYDEVAGMPSIFSNRYDGGAIAGNISPEHMVNVRAAIAHDSVILAALGWPVNVVEQEGYIPYIETDVPM